jgi:TrpR-related protein YerC/YecD
MNKINSQEERYFYNAILSLQNHRECSRFLKDLLTPNEFNVIIQRLLIAQMLSAGFTYNEISKKTKASTATVSRVNKALIYGNGGLLSVLERI